MGLGFPVLDLRSVCGRLASIWSVSRDPSSTDPDGARSGQVLLVGSLG